jgi:hypothetical protein
MRMILAAVFFCAACASSVDRTMASEAYAQRYNTSHSATSRSTHTITGAGGILSALAIIPAICNQIDSAKNRSEKDARCADLLRHLDAIDAAAYEWQSYFSRCKP